MVSSFAVSEIEERMLKGIINLRFYRHDHREIANDEPSDYRRQRGRTASKSMLEAFHVSQKA